MRILSPDQLLNKVTDIDLADLKAQGIKGLLIDLDNTLVRWDSQELAEEFSEWLTKARSEGFKMCLVSNGVPRRVRHFASLMDIPAVIPAFKPLSAAFRKAIKKLELSPKEVAMIGDQVFTDVLGGNRLGIHTILIKPLSTKELKSTRLVRKLERRVLNRLVKKGYISIGNDDGGK